jgi:hypothetical protein
VFEQRKGRVMEMTGFGVYRDFYEDKRIFTYCLPPKSKLVVVKGDEKHPVVVNPTTGVMSGDFLCGINEVFEMEMI